MLQTVASLCHSPSSPSLPFCPSPSSPFPSSPALASSPAPGPSSPLVVNSVHQESNLKQDFLDEIQRRVRERKFEIISFSNLLFLENTKIEGQEA